MLSLTNRKESVAVARDQESQAEDLNLHSLWVSPTMTEVAAEQCRQHDVPFSSQFREDERVPVRRQSNSAGLSFCFLEKDKLRTSVCGLETQLSWEAKQSIGCVWLWLCFIYALNRTLSTPVCPQFPFITVTAAPDRVQSASADSHRRTDLSCNLSKMSHRHMLADLFMRLRKPAKCK